MNEAEAIDALTDREVEAIGSAGAWYASYHARIIADHADDGSASALAQRERYLALLSGLEKLWVPRPQPTRAGRYGSGTRSSLKVR